MRALLDDRDPGTTAIQALRDWFKGAVNDPGFDQEGEIRRCKLIAETPGLAA